MTWATTLAGALEHPDPLGATLDLAREDRRIDTFGASLVFESSPPAGMLSDHLARVDRAFRLGARVAETGVAPEVFMQNRHRRGIPISEGMSVDALEPGSLWVPLKPSTRILKSVAVTGVVVVGTAISYLNGAFDLVDHLTDDDPSPSKVYIIHEAPKPQPILEIRIRRDGEGVDITLKATGSGYQLDAAQPIPQLEP